MLSLYGSALYLGPYEPVWKDVTMCIPTQEHKHSNVSIPKYLGEKVMNFKLCFTGCIYIMTDR